MRRSRIIMQFEDRNSVKNETKLKIGNRSERFVKINDYISPTFNTNSAGPSNNEIKFIILFITLGLLMRLPHFSFILLNFEKQN